MIAVLFWLGVIGAVREWRYANKIGAPIARTEKWYLAGGLVLAFAVSVIGDLMGLFGDVTDLLGTRTTAVLWVAAALVVWASRQMVRRTRSGQSAKTITTGQ